MKTQLVAYLFLVSTFTSAHDFNDNVLFAPPEYYKKIASDVESNIESRNSNFGTYQVTDSTNEQIEEENFYFTSNPDSGLKNLFRSRLNFGFTSANRNQNNDSRNSFLNTNSNLELAAQIARAQLFNMERKKTGLLNELAKIEESLLKTKKWILLDEEATNTEVLARATFGSAMLLSLAAASMDRFKIFSKWGHSLTLRYMSFYFMLSANLLNFYDLYFNENTSLEDLQVANSKAIEDLKIYRLSLDGDQRLAASELISRLENLNFDAGKEESENNKSEILRLTSLAFGGVGAVSGFFIHSDSGKFLKGLSGLSLLTSGGFFLAGSYTPEEKQQVINSIDIAVNGIQEARAVLLEDEGLVVP